MEKDVCLPVMPDPAFADPIPSLYGPLGAYVIKIIPLMLQHASQQRRDKNITAEEALQDCGWIGRLITLDNRVLHTERQNDIPGWPAVRDQLIESLYNHGGETEISKPWDESIAFLKPLLAARFIENYHFPKRRFHCWWWTIHDDNTHLALHLINAYQPASPFQNLLHFLQTMLLAIEDAIAQHPRIHIVSCGSWLNQLPKFQALWPASFQQHQKILNETGGFGPGAWGQYMTTSGGFNEDKATRLMNTGKHPFPLTEGRSPLNEVIDHLKKIISQEA